MNFLKVTYGYLKNYLKYYKLQILLIVIASIYTGLGAVAAVVGMQLANQAIAVDDYNRNNIICAILLVYYVSAFGAHYLIYWLNAKISQRSIFRMRNDLFHKINTLPMKYFDRTTPGEVMSNFTNDVNNIAVFLSDSLADLFGFAIWLISIGISLFIISWSLALITTTLFTIAIVVIVLKIRKSLPYFTKFQSELSEFTSAIEESVAGQSIIDLFEQQPQMMRKFDQIQKDLINKWEKATFLSLQSFPYVDLFLNIIITIVTGVSIVFIIIGYNFVNIPGLADINSTESMLGITAIYILLVRNFLSSLNQLPNVCNVGLSMKVGVERVKNVLSEESEFNSIEKLSIVLALEHHKTKSTSSKQQSLTLKPSVKFNSVNFEYEKNIPILKNISFEINERQFIGIVGPTGSGKTTIINLLTKLYEINNGDITIDNVSIKKINRNSLRKNITLVLQDTFLFHRTIRENLKLGSPNATDQQMVDACKKAQCHDLIMGLESGYDTVLSNDNNTLSKGQKQLLSIARAIITDAKLIIFDEATSSVDVTTEKLIHKAMKNLFYERTVIMIAHNLSTIRDADKILVIKDGVLLESGNHDELIKHNGFYAQLHNSQINELD